MSGLPVVAIVGRRTSARAPCSTGSSGADPPSWRTAPAPPATGSTAKGNGTHDGSRSSTPAGSRRRPALRLEAAVQQQARLAIEEADLIVLVVDATSGLTPADEEAAQILRRAPGRVFVAMNKADNDARELAAGEFFRLGWEECYPISAAHGRGTGDLLDAIVDALPPISDAERAAAERAAREEALADEFVEEVAAEAGGLQSTDDEELDELEGAESVGPITIALVGRPNVGKSSLLNALAAEERSIVSEIPAPRAMPSTRGSNGAEGT